jgi:hypothetical protein
MKVCWKWYKIQKGRFVYCVPKHKRIWIQCVLACFSFMTLQVCYCHWQVGGRNRHILVIYYDMWTLRQPQHTCEMHSVEQRVSICTTLAKHASWGKKSCHKFCNKKYPTLTLPWGGERKKKQPERKNSEQQVPCWKTYNMRTCIWFTKIKYVLTVVFTVHFRMRYVQ